MSSGAFEDCFELSAIVTRVAGILVTDQITR
jgi:hypothetical protein